MEKAYSFILTIHKLLYCLKRVIVAVKILDLVHKGISWGNLPSLSLSTGYKCSSKSFPGTRGHLFEIQTSERQFYQKKENKTKQKNGVRGRL